jgi:trigger factor
MQVSVESTGEIERKIMVEVPAERITQEVDSRLKNMRGNVRIDGFRPGKVPVSVVRERYGDSVFGEVVNELIQQTLYEAAEKEELRIASTSKVEPDDMALGKPLKYTATVEVYPEIKIEALDSLEITRQQVEIKKDDLDKMVETLRNQQKKWNDVEGAAEDGHQVTVDFDGSIDGESFDGGKSESVPVEIGSGKMLPDFETALLGMSAGDEKVADVSFPDDYQAEDLKGKTAQFKLMVSSVKEAILPEVDAEFYKLFGVENGSEDDFRAEVKKNMQRELSQRLKSNLKESVMNGLAELHTFESPTYLINQEIKHVRDEMSQGGGYDASSLPDELFKEQAERRVKLGLLVGEIIKQNNIQKDQGRVDAMLQELSASYEDSQAVIDYYKNNAEAMQSVNAAVMEEIIVEWVLGQAKVIDEDMNFYALLNPELQGQDNT